MELLDTLQGNVAAVKERMSAAALRAGRRAEEVELLAVSKTVPVGVIELAVQAGLRMFGENRVQELEEKAPVLAGGLDWHLIGPLQKNKVRRALGLAETIQSVDSLELAQRIDRIAAEEGRQPAVYWQVNVGDEASKSGFSEESLCRCAGELSALPHQRVVGLMAIPPYVPDVAEARRFFVQLRHLRDKLERETGLRLPGLSMGMSHDFEVAIEEGATVVRVGSALFGERLTQPIAG